MRLTEVFSPSLKEQGTIGSNGTPPLPVRVVSSGGFDFLFRVCILNRIHPCCHLPTGPRRVTRQFTSAPPIIAVRGVFAVGAADDADVNGVGVVLISAF